MVTGVETAGLILATIPLIIDLIDHYRNGLRPLFNFRDHRRRLGKIELQVEQKIFENTCFFLLRQLKDPKLQEDLLRDPYGQAWAKDENEAKLRKAMGSKSWKLFGDIIQKIGEIVALLSSDVQKKWFHVRVPVSCPRLDVLAVRRLHQYACELREAVATSWNCHCGAVHVAHVQLDPVLIHGDVTSSIQILFQLRRDSGIEGIPGWHKAVVSLPPDDIRQDPIKKIGNLCAKFRQYKGDDQSHGSEWSYDNLGYLSTGPYAGDRGRMYQIRVKQIGPRKLLTSGHRAGYTGFPGYFRPRDRLELALRLASATFWLFPSPWVEGELNADNIFLVRTICGDVDQQATREPVISVAFETSKASNSSNELKTQCKFMTQRQTKAAMFALGVLLMQVLEDMPLVEMYLKYIGDPGRWCSRK